VIESAQEYPCTDVFDDLAIGGLGIRKSFACTSPSSVVVLGGPKRVLLGLKPSLSSLSLLWTLSLLILHFKNGDRLDRNEKNSRLIGSEAKLRVLE
jgi:hypothetical protein